jgi:hypothetical protein
MRQLLYGRYWSLHGLRTYFYPSQYIFCLSVSLSLTLNKYTTPFPHPVQADFSCVG